MGAGYRQQWRKAGQWPWPVPALWHWRCVCGHAVCGVAVSGDRTITIGGRRIGGPQTRYAPGHYGGHADPDHIGLCHFVFKRQPYRRWLSCTGPVRRTLVGRISCHLRQRHCQIIGPGGGDRPDCLVSHHHFCQWSPDLFPVPGRLFSPAPIHHPWIAQDPPCGHDLWGHGWP